MITPYLVALICGVIWLALYVRDRRRQNWVKRVLDVRPAHFDTDADLHVLHPVGVIQALKHRRAA